MSSKRLPPIVKSSFDSISDPEDFSFGNGVGFTPKQLREIFPFHVTIDVDFNIIQLGNKLANYFRTHNICKNPIYHHVKDFFQIISPTSCSWDWKTLRKDVGASFELELLIPASSFTTPRDVTKANRVFLIGGLSISEVQENNDFSKFTATFLLSPNVHSNEELTSLDFKMSDFPVHSFQRELLSLEAQMQSVTNSMYTLDEENKMLKAENERLNSELHGAENIDMRHMIANVAHDLKTPLSAFLNGIDMISDVIKQTEDHLAEEEHAKDIEYTKETLDFIKNNVTNISEINSFMMMTINRCIDYTKASQGVKLVPSPDTMCVEDALRLPLHCMSVLQGKMQIQLTPLSSDICSHIITDKQWFQENVLCLLSNAVKYSYQGVVQVTVTLKPSIDSIAPKQSSCIQQQQKNRSRSVSNASVSSVSPSRSSTIIEHHGLDHRPSHIQSHYQSASPSIHDRDRDSNASSNINQADLVSLDMLSRDDNDIDPVPRKAGAAVHRVSGVSVDSLFRTSLDEESPDILGIASPDSFKILTHIAVSPTTTNNSGNGNNSAGHGESPASLLDSPARRQALLHHPHHHASSPHGSGEMSKSNKFLARALNMVAEKLQDDSLGPLLMVEIEDTGIGLSEEMMANLFSPFSQAQKLAGGTGLGLFSLAKRVEALHGYFGVEKRRDNQQGSLFWFAIPYKPDYEASNAAGKDADLGLGMTSSSAGFGLGDGRLRSRPGRAAERGGVTQQSSSSEHSGSFAIAEDEEYEDSVPKAGFVGTSLLEAGVAAAAAGVTGMSEKDGPPILPSLSYSDSFYKESPKSKKSGKHQRSPSGGKSPSNYSKLNKSGDSCDTTNLYPEGVVPQSIHAEDALNILMVDDSFPILKMTVQVLSRAGYNVDTAVNGAEAIEKIDTHLRTTGHNYDVVLMDLHMPVIDGLEATRRVRLSEAKMIAEYQAHVEALTAAAAAGVTPGSSLSAATAPAVDSPHSNGSNTARQEYSGEIDLTSLKVKIPSEPLLPPSHLVMIGVSASDDNETAMAAFEAGFDGFMCKPFKLQTFQDIYANVTEQQKMAGKETSTPLSA